MILDFDHNDELVSEPHPSTLLEHARIQVKRPEIQPLKRAAYKGISNGEETRGSSVGRFPFEYP
jgi:hypothetical protein